MKLLKYDYDKVKVNENECVSAKSEEEAVKITDKLKELGGSWVDTRFYECKEKTVYFPYGDTYDCDDVAILEGYKIITCDEWLARFNDAPVKSAPKPAPKHVFETQFKLNGQDFDIVSHREKIARLKAELKEAQEIEKAFVKFNQK